MKFGRHPPEMHPTRHARRVTRAENARGGARKKGAAVKKCAPGEEKSPRRRKKGAAKLVTRASRSFIIPWVGIGIETRGLGAGAAAKAAGAGRAGGAKGGRGEKISPPRGRKKGGREIKKRGAWGEARFTRGTVREGGSRIPPFKRAYSIKNRLS